MLKYRFFKCNILGGFRLSDLNKNVKQDEYFFIEEHVANTSRAVTAAIRERWMTEVTEKVAANHISIPREISAGGVQNKEISKKPVKSQVASPDVSETNKGIEQRQAQKQGVATPNLAEADKKIRARANETKTAPVTTPSGAKAKPPKVAEGDKPAIPNFNEVEENTKSRHEDSINKMGASTDTELAKQSSDTQVIEKPEKKETTVVKDETITSLADDDMFDNSQVSTPNFDEKNENDKEKEAAKEEIAKKIDEKAAENDKKEEAKASDKPKPKPKRKYRKGKAAPKESK